MTIDAATAAAQLSLAKDKWRHPMAKWFPSSSSSASGFLCSFPPLASMSLEFYATYIYLCAISLTRNCACIDRTMNSREALTAAVSARFCICLGMRFPHHVKALDPRYCRRVYDDVLFCSARLGSARLGSALLSQELSTWRGVKQVLRQSYALGGFVCSVQVALSLHSRVTSRLSFDCCLLPGIAAAAAAAAAVSSTL